MFSTILHLSVIQVQLTWRACLSKAEEQTLNLIEHAVFSTVYDDPIRVAVKNRRDVGTMLTAAPLNTLVEEIDESLRNSASGGGDPGAEVVDDDDNHEDHGGRAPQDDVAALPESVQIEITKAGDEHKPRLDQFVAACWRKVDMYVDLIQESSDIGGMTDKLKATAVNAMRKEPQAQDASLRRFILIVYDLKSAGEASSHPSTRVPPLRGNGDHLKGCLRVALDAIDGGEICSRDMFMLFDGGSHGLKPRLLSGFTAQDGTTLANSVRHSQLNKDD